jgi:hypothetical protein
MLVPELHHVLPHIIHEVEGDSGRFRFLQDTKESARHYGMIIIDLMMPFVSTWVVAKALKVCSVMMFI